MARRLYIFFISSCILINLFSCNFGNHAFPYIIENLECSLESEQGAFNHLGIKFKILNTSKKDIKNVSVAFILYDKKQGKNPLVTSNFIEARFSGEIKSGESKEFEVSLDDKIHYVPSSPYYIDCFYVKKINYSDNSFWNNFCCSYIVSENDL